MKINVSTIGERTSQFKQSSINKVVLCVHADRIYARDGLKLAVSKDAGKTWTDAGITLASGTFDNVYVTQKGVILAFANRPSKMFRSSDEGLTWTEIVVHDDGWILPFPQGIGSNGDTIIFGEWTLNEFPVSRMFKSTNGGRTWTIIKTLQQPDEVRHFHTCQYFGEGIWIATSGDYSTGEHYTDEGSGQVHWHISRDNGETFEELGVPGELDQRYRTLGVHLLGGTELMWSSDAVPGETYGGIYKAPLSDPLDVRVVYPLGKTSWGIAGGAGKYVAVTSLEPGDSDNMTHAFSSVDGGESWQLESYHNAKEGDTFVGFRFPMGLDNFGNIYVQTNSLGFVPGTSADWRATTIFNVL